MTKSKALVMKSVQVKIIRQDLGTDPFFHKYPIRGEAIIYTSNLKYICQIIEKSQNEYFLRTSEIKTKQTPLPGEFEDINHMIEYISGELSSYFDADGDLISETYEKITEKMIFVNEKKDAKVQDQDLPKNQKED